MRGFTAANGQRSQRSSIFHAQRRSVCGCIKSAQTVLSLNRARVIAAARLAGTFPGSAVIKQSQDRSKWFVSFSANVSGQAPNDLYPSVPVFVVSLR